MFRKRLTSLVLIICMFALLMCPQIAFAASESRVIINDRTGLVAIEGHLDYVDGTNEAYIVIPADGKSYSDFAVANTTEELLSAVKYLGYVPVSKDGRYATSFTVENIKSEDAIYVSYNGNVFEANSEEMSSGRKLVIDGSVEYNSGVETLDVFILALGHTYEEFEEHGDAVVLKKITDVPVSEDGKFTCTVSDASDMLVSNIVVFRYNGEDTYRELNAYEFVVSVYVDSVYGSDTNSGNSVSSALKTLEKAEATYAKSAEYGYSGEIILCGGEYTSIPLSVAAPENGHLSYVGASGEETVITQAARLPVSAFKRVCDADVLARLDSNAAGYVYQIDLDEYNIPSSAFPVTGYEMSKAALYLNSKPQTIARWPNGGYADLTATSAGTVNDGEKDINLYTFTNDVFGKWSNAPGIYLEGFFISSRPWIREYVDVKSVDTQQKTIIIQSPPYGGLGSTEASGTKTCKVVVNNALEAIDVPGEWYVDTDTMTMYYYMPDNVSDSDILELSYSKSSAIGSSSKNIENVCFDNLTIRGSRGNLINFNNAKNLAIRNCVIEDAHFGIIIANSKNTVIENNVFRYIKGNAIHISAGGDPETITPSGNVISGNHIYECATVGTHGSNNYTVNIRLGRSQSQPSIIGDVIRNNVVHGSPYAEAVMHNGMENDISYNEFYNLLHYVSDAGVIYNGNRLNMYGTYIHHNYIHDFEHTLRSGTDNQISAIYWDDYQSGQKAEYNIIVGNNGNNTRGLLEVGRDNTANYNLVVAAKKGMIFSDRNKDDFKTFDAYKGLKSVSQAILDKYPQIAATKQSIDEDPNNHFHTEGNKAWGNMHVDVTDVASESTALSGSQKSYTLDLKANHINFKLSPDSNGNITAFTKSGYDDIFVDHKNHDWRLKTSFISEYSSHLEQNLLTDSNFDIGTIGLAGNCEIDKNQDTSFSLAYPVSRTVESDGTVTLAWEKALYADNYTYEIATDSAFSNVVATGNTLSNCADVSGLELNTNYYWRVTAHNISKEMGSDWESNNGVATFRIEAADYKVKNIRFFDENNQEIKDMSNFASAKYATYDFVNRTTTEIEYDLIISLYENSGAKLKQVLTYTKKCKGAVGENNYRVELETPANYASGDLVYVFAWDKDGSINPIAKKNILE